MSNAQQSISSAVPVSAEPKRGVSLVWVFVALAAGLVVGAAAVFGVNAYQQASAAKQPKPVDDMPLASGQWWSSDDALPQGAVEPGSRLTLGTAAKVVLGAASGDRTVATVTIDSVTALDEKDIKLLNSAQPALAGQKLFRIDYRVKYVSGDPLAGMLIGDAIFPVDAEGAKLLRVPVSGWKTCGATALPVEVDGSDETPAAEVAMCSVAGSPDGGAGVVGALFAQSGGPYSFADKGQLTWLPATG